MFSPAWMVRYRMSMDTGTFGMKELQGKKHQSIRLIGTARKRFLMVGKIRFEGQILLGERWKKREIEFISSVDAYRSGTHLGSGVHQIILRVTRATIFKLFSLSSSRHHPGQAGGSDPAARGAIQPPGKHWLAAWGMGFGSRLAGGETPRVVLPSTTRNPRIARIVSTALQRGSWRCGLGFASRNISLRPVP
jgi:hypothetical protein